MIRFATFLLFALLASPMAAQQSPIPGVAYQRAEVLSVRPHDTNAFTQGLVYHDGKLYESTGRYGLSTLRRVDPVTGVVEKQIDLPKEYFAEGLVLVNDRLIQLTWKEKKAFVYDRETFEKIGEFAYEGEGWGLTYDGTRLLMSDGSDTITARDPMTFAPLETISVTLGGEPLRNLNELEVVDGLVYANIWQKDLIAQIDPASGEVVGLILLSGLLSAEQRAKTDVVNGIAYDPTTRSFLVTGKLWPSLFEVRFVPNEGIN
jgi:glutamine cyclotransferase